MVPLGGWNLRAVMEEEAVVRFVGLDTGLPVARLRFPGYGIIGMKAVEGHATLLITVFEGEPIFRAWVDEGPYPGWDYSGYRESIYAVDLDTLSVRWRFSQAAEYERLAVEATADGERLAVFARRYTWDEAGEFGPRLGGARSDAEMGWIVDVETGSTLKELGERSAAYREFGGAAFLDQEGGRVYALLRDGELVWADVDTLMVGYLEIAALTRVKGLDLSGEVLGVLGEGLEGETVILSWSTGDMVAGVPLAMPKVEGAEGDERLAYPVDALRPGILLRNSAGQVVYADGWGSVGLWSLESGELVWTLAAGIGNSRRTNGGWLRRAGVRRGRLSRSWIWIRGWRAGVSVWWSFSTSRLRFPRIAGASWRAGAEAVALGCST